MSELHPTDTDLHAIFDLDHESAVEPLISVERRELDGSDPRLDDLDRVARGGPRIERERPLQDEPAVEIERVLEDEPPADIHIATPPAGADAPAHDAPPPAGGPMTGVTKPSAEAPRSGS